jgi:competence protein ComEC
MKLLAFVPIKLTLLLIVGILIGHYFPFNSSYALWLTVFLFVILGFVYRYERNTKSIRFGIFAYLTTLSLGIFIILSAQPKQDTHHYSNLRLTQKPVWQLQIREVLKPTNFSERYIAEIQGVDNLYATGRLIVTRNFQDSLQPLQVDDELLIISQLTEIKKPLNPHQFNYNVYLKQLGIFHQLRLEASTYGPKTNPSKTVFGIAAKARNHIIKQLKKEGFGKEELGLIQALLLGQRNDISKETYDNYKNAGAVHILALSGLHIGILLLVLQFLLRPLDSIPQGKKIRLLLTVLLLWGFAFLAGLSASLVRACTMFSFVAYALYLNRPSNTFNILALSMFFILLFINPNLLFQVGFQMSYAAVLSIVWIYPLLQKFWYPKAKPIRYVWQLLSVSVAAQLGVLPISLFYFHQFPGLFFVSNLLIVPALGIILGTGILVVILSLINLLPDRLAWFYNEVISYMNTIVVWVAAQEDFIFKQISFDGIQLIFAFCTIIALVLVLAKMNFKRVVYFLISVLCFQQYTLYQEIRAGQEKEVLLLHQTKNTVLVDRNGTIATVYILDSIRAQALVSDLKIGERIDAIHFDTLINSYFINERSVIFLDSLGTYLAEKKGNSLVLTNSPKINLERVIAHTKPKIIIADGSNYMSYINRWKVTCMERKIPFHYTGEKGFYSFE